MSAAVTSVFSVQQKLVIAVLELGLTKQVLKRASLVAQVKNPPAKQEMWAQSLGQEDPLKKGMATHSSILAGRILWTEEPGGLESMGSQ